VDSQTLHWEHPNIKGPELLQLLRTEVPQALGGVVPVTATVLTLGLYVKGIPETDWMELAEKISHVHPSRVLIINPITGAPEDTATHVDAQISATVTYRRPGEPPTLFSECVQMNLGGGLANHWIDLVQSLIKSDLPAYLLWLGAPPLPGFRWDLLSTGFTHLVIDSEQAGLGPWKSAILAGKPQGMMVDDLYWQRLGLWRAHWATLTDYPEGLLTITNPEKIVIAWPGPRPWGWRLLLGWLIDRLNWSVSDLEPTHVSLIDDYGQTIPVEIREADEPSFSFYHGDYVLSSQRANKQLQSRIVKSTEELYTMADPCNQADPVTDIVKLLNRGHDQLFDQALSALILNEHA
jgi:glucose-6-phosphate dehydrogenase assembly protein OpcA